MVFKGLFRKGLAVPSFKVGVYGKLPCYKDFFFISPNPAFSEWKTTFDQVFEKLAASEVKRPYVLPNRRFYLRLPHHKSELVGCIWESDDGMRGYPFMMAATFGKGLAREPFPRFWQVLEAVWAHLEGFGEELFALEQSEQVFHMCRGTQHKLEPLQPETWEQAEDGPQLEQPFFIRDLVEMNEAGEQALIRSFRFEIMPQLVLWPMPAWRESGAVRVPACFGEFGLADFQADLFDRASEADEERVK